MSLKPKSILIVDDDDDLRQLVTFALAPLGCKITEANNGRAALEIIADTQPDLIILDMMMPEMNGIEFLKTMLEDLEELEVPVLVTSAVSDRARFMQEFFQMPILRKAFVRKPYTPDELLAKAKEMLTPTQTQAAPAKMGPRAPQPPPGRPGQALDEFLQNVLPTPPQGVRAPVAPPAPVKPAAAPTHETPRQRLRALLIDDDEDLLAMLRLTLAPYHEIATATSGIDALTMLDQFAPDFIICDYAMPGLNGIQTIEAIRSHPRFHAVPVFLLTAQEETDLPKKMFEVGGNLFLRKPMDPGRLPRIIDTFVAQADVRPQAVIATGKTATPAHGGVVKPRVLVVDADPANVARMREFLDVRARGKVDAFYAAEPRVALGNVGRWEPDVILYNPRNASMDGIMFTQTLRVQKLFGNFQLAFIGHEFIRSDLELSQKVLGRNLIDLRAPDETIMAALGEVVGKAAGKIGPKRYGMDEIRTQDRIYEEEQVAKKTKVDRQRQFQRERYMKIQEFIDQELKR